MDYDNMSVSGTVTASLTTASVTAPTQNILTTGGTVTVKPREVKGGVFAPADIELIKKALSYYVARPINEESTAAVQEEKQIANLLHRLNNRI